MIGRPLQYGRTKYLSTAQQRAATLLASPCCRTAWSLVFGGSFSASGSDVRLTYCCRLTFKQKALSVGCLPSLPP